MVQDDGFRRSYRLPNASTIFQCDIYAIYMAAVSIQNSPTACMKLAICVDSQAALKAFDSIKTSSVMVKNCKESLNNLGRVCEVVLIRTPRHSNIECNEIADYVANRGADMHISWAENIPLPLSSIYQ